MCNNQGSCVNGTCDCGFNGWRGEFCGTKGCPGHDVSCSDHGTCLVTGNCTCLTGWTGVGCHVVQCLNDCSGHGSCLALEPPDTPRCECLEGYFATDCSKQCVHGTVLKPNPADPSSWECVCNSCYTGETCELECSGRDGARCNDGVCDCGTAGWRGLNCEKAGCPGLGGTDCSGHGDCITSSAEDIGQCQLVKFLYTKTLNH